jgi:membrane fusion protein (multidrug efflux system)
LEYQSDQGKNIGVAKEQPHIELELANSTKFNQLGKIGAIEADFNNETGNIAFRADFPNPGGVLRHGQTGNVLINHVVHNAIVIPQRATFEILDKRYVYVVGEDHVVHQHEIAVENELEDVYVIKAEGATGIAPDAQIVLEGVRDIRDGDRIDGEFRPPEDVLAALKQRAE